jgi:hypothetical protein
VISDSTHIEGSLLDHIYTNIEPQSQFIHPVYFSDHDATCLILRILTLLIGSLNKLSMKFLYTVLEIAGIIQ